MGEPWSRSNERGMGGWWNFRKQTHNLESRNFVLECVSTCETGHHSTSLWNSKGFRIRFCSELVVLITAKHRQVGWMRPKVWKFVLVSSLFLQDLYGEDTGRFGWESLSIRLETRIVRGCECTEMMRWSETRNGKTKPQARGYTAAQWASMRTRWQWCFPEVRRRLVGLLWVCQNGWAVSLEAGLVVCSLFKEAKRTNNPIFLPATTLPPPLLNHVTFGIVFANIDWVDPRWFACNLIPCLGLQSIHVPVIIEMKEWRW